MDEHSSGDSAATIIRLSERAQGHAGVVDTEHPRQLYQRTAGWAAERFPLLAHLIGRYDVNDYASAQDKPLLTVQPMSTTTHDISQFVQTADPDSRIARQADNSPSPSHSLEASSPAPAKYRISRRPSSLARMTDRSVLNTASLANSSDIQSSETVSASQSQTRGDAAQPNRAADVDLPMVSQNGTNGITLEREAASAAEKDGSSDSDRLSTGLARRTKVETPPPSNESKSTASAPINVAHSSISSSAIIQKQQAPAEFVYLKRYDIRRADRRNLGAQSELAPAQSASFDREVARSSAGNAALTGADSPLSPSALTTLNPEAPAAKPAATELSRQQLSHLPAPLVLRKGSADAAASMEESPARPPIQQPLSATGRQARDEVSAIRGGTETDLPGNASSHRRPATAELIEQQLNHAAEPLILRQIRSDTANVREETDPDAEGRLPLSVQAQDPDLLKFTDRTATKLSGGEAAHPNIDSSNETVVAESFVLQHLPRPAPSLISSSATASSSNGTALPLVFLESSQTQRAVQRSSEGKAGAAPLVAPEMRADSDQAAPPGIVWRKSATTQRDASLPVTQMTAGVLVARQPNGSSAAGGLPVAQSPPSVESNVSHSNGDNHNGGSIDVEHLIRVLHKRLAIERERRGIGR